MARGFDSKSVEEQQNEVQRVEATDPKKTSNADELQKKRRIQELNLQRERILSERTSSPHRRQALELALASIEEKLAELGWAIHL